MTKNTPASSSDSTGYVQKMVAARLYYLLEKVLNGSPLYGRRSKKQKEFIEDLKAAFREESDHVKKAALSIDAVNLKELMLTTDLDVLKRFTDGKSIFIRRAVRILREVAAGDHGEEDDFLPQEFDPEAAAAEAEEADIPEFTPEADSDFDEDEDEDLDEAQTNYILSINLKHWLIGLIGFYTIRYVFHCLTKRK